MIKKVTITQVYTSDKNKAGEPYSIKNGKDAGTPFKRIGIRTDETGDDTYYNNARPTDKANNLAIGQVVILNFVEEPNKEGTAMFKNFKFPSKAELEIYSQFNPSTTSA